MSHPSLLNLRRYYAGEITLQQMIEMNSKFAPLKTYDDKPPEIVKIEKMFGATRPFGHEKSCPKEEDRWNY